MYTQHLREIKGKKNLRQGRTQYYSITQQIIRQDPIYQIAYVVLQPNYVQRLLLNPYYIKYTTTRDLTAFRHLDQNALKMLQGLGTSIIQGSLALTPETLDNYTILVPSMHKQFLEQVEDLQNTRLELLKTRHVIDINQQNLSNTNLYKHYASQKKVPCQARQVQILEPRLAYRSIRLTKGLRINYFPQFVCLNINNNVELGRNSFEDLTKAYYNLTMPPKTLSRHPFSYGRLYRPFLASIRFNCLGPILKCLIGQIEQSLLEARVIVNLLLYDDDELLLKRYRRVKALINNQRKEVLGSIQEARARIISNEKQLYSDKSYYQALEEAKAASRPLSFSDCVEPNFLPPKEEDLHNDDATKYGDYEHTIKRPNAEDIVAIRASQLADDSAIRRSTRNRALTSFFRRGK